MTKIHILKSWPIKSETQAATMTWTTFKQFRGRHKNNGPSNKEETPFRTNVCWSSSQKLPPQLNYSSGDTLAPFQTVKHRFSSWESHINGYSFHCVSDETPVHSWIAMVLRDEELLWYAAETLRLRGVQGPWGHSLYNKNNVGYILWSDFFIFRFQNYFYLVVKQRE